MPVSGVSVGGADPEGVSDGLPPGSADGDGDGVKVPPCGVEGELLGVDGDAGEEQAPITTSMTRRTGTRAKGRIGLVGVEADVGRLDRRERAVAEQAGFLAQELKLGAQPGGGVGELEQMLLA